MLGSMRADDLALVQGMRHTRETLTAWNHQPWPVIRGWLGGSVAIVAALLLSVWLLSLRSAPDPTPILLPGLHGPAGWSDVAFVLYRNSLVLALHALACVAGFIVRSSPPAETRVHRGARRWAHNRAGDLALAFVAGATLFSLVTQVIVLGRGTATLSGQLGLAPHELLLGVMPHALPELVALFLPLAAWIAASRAGRWDELLAATFVTVALAAPVLVVSALVEVWVSPGLLARLAG
jgi:hypothetical protein